MLKEKIKLLAEKYFEEIVQIRRHIHQNPELAFKEYETSKFIAAKLREINVNFQIVAETGIIATMQFKNPQKRTIALRADIDALPINENNSLVYQSQNKGVMHACGHDANAAMLLGTIKILQDIKDDLEGTIIAIFQPAEELIPGGASILLQTGILQKLDISVILAQHCFPEIETGKLGFKKGYYMASSDEIYININGKGGHGAIPSSFTDTVLTSAHIITALQQVISRKNNPLIPSLLSFGKVVADGSTNVMPDQVKIEGTFRTMDENNRKYLHTEIIKTATNIAKAFDNNCEIEIRKGYPALLNNEEYTEKAIKFASELLGENNIANDLPKRMSSEDFANYSAIAPIVFYRIGSKIDGYDCQMHNCNFQINEDCLKIGTETMTYLATKFLE